MKDVRNFFGLSQQELAAYFAVDRSYVAQIENGTRGMSSRVSKKYVKLMELFRDHCDFPQPEPLRPQEAAHMANIVRMHENRRKQLAWMVRNGEKKLAAQAAALKTHHLTEVFIKFLQKGEGHETLLAGAMAADQRQKSEEVNEEKLYALAWKLELLKKELEMVEAELVRFGGEV